MPAGDESDPLPGVVLCQPAYVATCTACLDRSVRGSLTGGLFFLAWDGLRVFISHRRAPPRESTAAARVADETSTQTDAFAASDYEAFKEQFFPVVAQAGFRIRRVDTQFRAYPTSSVPFANGPIPPRGFARSTSKRGDQTTIRFCCTDTRSASSKGPRRLCPSPTLSASTCSTCSSRISSSTIPEREYRSDRRGVCRNLL